MTTVSDLVLVINRLLPEPHAGLLAGLLFGTKATLPDDFYDALVTSGTIHIIALSGMNIAILSHMVASSLTWSIGKRWATAVTLVVILLFVWFVGFSPSIVRAAIMGSLSLIAILLGRMYLSLLSWVVTVGVMLIINPSWIGDISFQLSTMATLGILMFGKSTYKGSWLVSTVKENLHLTLAAQVFTIPLILFHFQRISLIAPVSNLLIGWVIAPLTALGWMTIFVGNFVLLGGMILAWIDWVLLEYIIRTVYIASLVPGASIGW
jgi:competence protein ComEC